MSQDALETFLAQFPKQVQVEVSIGKDVQQATAELDSFHIKTKLPLYKLRIERKTRKGKDTINIGAPIGSKAPKK